MRRQSNLWVGLTSRNHTKLDSEKGKNMQLCEGSYDQYMIFEVAIAMIFGMLDYVKKKLKSTVRYHIPSQPVFVLVTCPEYK
jgi:hypothetical protein